MEKWFEQSWLAGFCGNQLLVDTISPVNRSGKAMPPKVKLSIAEIQVAVYIKDSFQIHKGIWVFHNGDWNLDKCSRNITDQAKSDI